MMRVPRSISSKVKMKMSHHQVKNQAMKMVSMAKSKKSTCRVLSDPSLLPLSMERRMRMLLRRP